VRDALKQARPGDRIIVHEGITIDQDLHIDGKRAPHLRGVRLEAAPNEKVTWTLPPGQKRPARLLQLDDVDGFTIKGFVFDGGGEKLDYLIVLNACPSVRLEDVELQNFKVAGVHCINCGRSDEKPVELIRVVGGVAAAPCLLVEVRRNIAGPRSNHVLVSTDCNLLGPAPVKLINPMGEREPGVRIPPGLNVVIEKKEPWRGPVNAMGVRR
jgi:hypothetical protein